MKYPLYILAACIMLAVSASAFAQSSSIPINLTYWQSIDNVDDTLLRQTPDGLSLSANGYRGRLILFSKQTYDIQNCEIFWKWKATGICSYAGIGFGAIMLGYQGTEYGGTNCLHVTTEHSWMGSYVAAEDTWYYVRGTIGSDRIARGVMSLNDYDVNGGNVLTTFSSQIEEDMWEQLASSYIYIGIGDAYGGSADSILVSEVKTTASPVPEPSSILALLCGIGGMGGMIWRRKSA